MKVLREALRAVPEVRVRFQREAQVVASLRHPHIVPIYAVGEFEGLAFFVMPHMDGESLADALDHGVRWSLPQVCRILRECAGALAEAHREGLVHRDVKPENIFLEGPERRAVLMDFGIAKSTDEAASSITATGMLIGSPHYMSPEQAVGDAVDQFSDQYSLALVGHRMLTGRPAFEAENLRALLYKQATEDPPPVAELRPDTPPSLAAIITRALAKDRTRRFASMREMEGAITRVAGEVAGDFRRHRVQAPLRERWTSALERLYHRPWVAPLVAVAALALFGFVYPRGQAAGARVALGARDAAVGRAHRILDSTGAAALPIERINLSWNGPLYQYLQRAAHPELALADRAQLVWVWDISRGSPTVPDAVRLSVRPDGRVQLYRRQIDNPGGRSLTAYAALERSVAALAQFGIPVDALGPAQHFSTTTEQRTDHTFAWSTPAVTTPGEERVGRHVQAAWTGSDLSFVLDSRSTPPGTGAGLASGSPWFGALAGVVVLVLGFTALGLATRRARFDTVQWGMGLRLALLFFALQLIGVILPTLPDYRATMPWAAIVADVIATIPPMVVRTDTVAPFVMLVVAIAAAESLIYERRPDLIAGMDKASRLRLMTPELMRAVPAGYAAGIVLALLQAGANIGWQRWGGVPVSPAPALTPEAITSGLGTLGILSEVRYMAMLFACAALLVGVGLRSGRPWLGTLAFVPLAFLLDINFGKPLGALAPYTVVDALVLGLWSVLLYRQGWLAAILAFWIFRALPVMGDLLWAGGSYRSAIAPSIAILLIPAGLALFTYLRRPRGAALDLATAAIAVEGVEPGASARMRGRS